MANPTQYQVDTCHLRVGIGECTVVCMSTAPPKGQNLPELQKVVLIDGGLPSWFRGSGASRIIRNFIINLRDFYFLPEGRYPGKLVRLDTVVITHWDQDHYGGIASMINEDLSIGTQCQLFRYGPDGTPQTWMYVPYMIRSGKQKPPKMFGISPDSPERLKFKLHGWSNWLANSQICLIRYGADQVLGVDFFTNTRPRPGTINVPNHRPADITTIVPVDCESLSHLMNAHNELGAGNPGLFCVGCNNYVFQKPSSTATTGGGAASSSSNPISFTSSSLHPFPTTISSENVNQTTPQNLPKPSRPHELIIDNKPTAVEGEETNSSSIMAVLAWKNTTTTEKTRVSHYLTGDALWSQEEPLSVWLKSTCVVKTMKLSHHGSLYSSPISIFENLNPSNVILSAWTAYIHPRPEILLWLQGWNPFPYLTPMCFPYYLVKYVQGGQMRFAPRTINMPALWHSTKRAILDYQESLKSLPGFQRSYFFEDFPNVQTQLQSHVLNYLWDKWPLLSTVPRCCSPYNPDTYLSYVWAYSSPSMDVVRSVPERMTRPNTNKRRLPDSFQNPPGSHSGPNLKWGRLTVSTSMGAADPKLLMAVQMQDEDDSKGEFPNAFVRSAAQPVVLPTLLPASSSPALPSDKYYICFSDIVISAPQVLALHADDPLNDFLKDLNDRYIALEANPGASGANLLGSGAYVDELADWFNSSLGARQVTIKLRESVSMSSMSIKISTPFMMTFSTDSVSHVFSSAPSLPCGYMASQGTMVFGLASTGDLSGLSLSAILDFLGLPSDHLLDLAGTLELDTVGAPRNAIWFAPWNNYETVLRMQFTFDRSILTSFITHYIHSLTFNSLPKVIIRKKSIWSPNGNGYTCVSDPQIILSVSVNGPGGRPLDVIFTYDGGVVSLIARPSDRSLDELLVWVAGLVGADTADLSLRSWLTSVSPNHVPIVLELRIQLTTSGVQMFSIVMALKVDFGTTGDQSQKAAFLLTYRWKTQEPHHELTGSLWCPVAVPPTLGGLPLEFDPNYEPLLLPVQPPFTDLTPFLHLTSLIPDERLEGIPAELDLAILFASITITSNGMNFEGELVTKPSPPAKTFPITLSRISLGASYQFASSVAASGGTNQPSTTQSSYDIGISAIITIYDQTGTDYTNILASVSYKKASKTWHLLGSIGDLKMTTLFELFPSTDTAVMDIMGHLELKGLLISYDYGSDGIGNHFLVSGSLIIDIPDTVSLELDVSFDRLGDTWTFTSKLGLLDSTQDVSIFQLLNGLVNDPDIVNLIPSFAKNVSFSTGTGTGLSLVATKTSGFVTFILSLNLKGEGNTPDLSFNLIQIKSAKGGKNVPTKRLVRVSIESIPFTQIPNIPLVGSLKQPFKEMDYIWAHDDGGLGLTRQEIGCINSIPHFFGIKYKELIAEKDQKPTDVLLVAGSHFLVTASDGGSTSGTSVVLDYVFGRPASSNAAVTHAAFVSTINIAAVDDSLQGDTSMAKLQQSQGPLSIANFGLRYSNDTLSILLDATVRLGPIEFALLGFGLSLEFATLRSIPRVKPSLSGMAIELNLPPVEIAGIFEDLSTANQVKYVGGVVLGLNPYSFTALGSYGEITDTSNHSFKSVFVFCQLNGPLVELEFAEIQGITAGFGYNSSLRYPTIDEVDSFPFIDHSYGAPGSDPLALFAKLTNESGPGWIKSQEGPLWLAAGLEVKAFQTLFVQAVIVLEFNPYVSLGIFAKAIAAIPAPPEGRPPSSSGAFVYAELGIVSSVDFHAGSMLVEAKLSPNSFILDPSCHLSGGFALCQWFGPSEHAGDWVFTVGGYHPAFNVPSHYPAVDRLGISWNLGGGLSVTGQAYFAITPKVCMGGGYLSAVLDLGALSAYFRAHADFLINYSPFHFIGDIGVSVGVQFTLDLWICTIHISVDIGASVHLEGPPFGGYVHVDFWVFGFTVHFGDSGNADDAIDLLAFWQLLLQQPGDTPTTTMVSATAVAAPAGSTDSAPTIAQISNAHVLAVETGRHPRSSQTTNIETAEGAAWVVRPQGFKFLVQSRFAIGAAAVNGLNGIVYPTPIYAKPMHLVAGTDDQDEHIQSTLNIVIAPQNGESLGKFKCDPVTKKVPSALWGAYSEQEDPHTSGNSITTLLKNNNDITVELMMAVSVTSPPPFLFLDPIQPFDALAAMSEDVYTDEDYETMARLALPSSLTASLSEWAPKPLASVSADDALPWTTVQHAWENPIDAADGYEIADVPGAWAQALGWSIIPIGEIPKRLIDGIELYSLSAPFVGVV